MWWSIYGRGVATSTSIKEADRLVSLLPSLKTAEGWQRCTRSLSGNMMNNLSLCQWPIFVCHSRLCEQDSSRAEVTAPCRKSVHSAYEVALNFCNYMYIVKCIYKFTHMLYENIMDFLIFDNKWPQCQLSRLPLTFARGDSVGGARGFKGSLFQVKVYTTFS